MCSCSRWAVEMTALSKFPLSYLVRRNQAQRHLYSSTNEKLDRANFIKGVSLSFHMRCQGLNASFFQSKLLGTYLYEVAAIKA